ncbi:MAG: DUF4277 domain-containing protein [Methanothrix sp.]|jgi:hypothetical protein|nr:DUF4277 domain-containing protein [Methanothrix sp.]
MKITSTQIDHLGLVAGVFDRLGIGEVIDSHLPKSRHHKVPHSGATKVTHVDENGPLREPFSYQLTNK